MTRWAAYRAGAFYIFWCKESVGLDSAGSAEASAVSKQVALAPRGAAVWWRQNVDKRVIITDVV